MVIELRVAQSQYEIVLMISNLNSCGTPVRFSNHACDFRPGYTPITEFLSEAQKSKFLFMSTEVYLCTLSSSAFTDHFVYCPHGQIILGNSTELHEST